MSESYVLSFWNLGNTGLLWKGTGRHLTSFLYQQINFRKSYRCKLKISETGGLKTKCTPNPWTSPGGCTCETEDHWCQLLHHLVEFDKKDMSAQVRPWLGNCTLVFTLWEHRTVACNTRDKTANPSWLLEFLLIAALIFSTLSCIFFSVVINFNFNCGVVMLSLHADGLRQI